MKATDAERRDLAGAALLVVVGACAIWFGRGLRYGTSADMGPGYFPAMLGAIVCAVGILLGLATLLRRRANEEEISARLNWRPLVVIAGSPFLFGFLIGPLGLFFSIVIVVLVARLAEKRRFTWEAPATALVLAALCCLLFIVVLELPLSVWP